LPTVRVRLKSRNSAYSITVRRGVLEEAGDLVVPTLQPQARKAVLISNTKVFGLYGQPVSRSLKRAGLEVRTFLIGDGERYKTLRTLDSILQFLSAEKLERNDSVVALGGGVVGDLAGFAAAVYLRGIDFVQIPTTLLAQIDSSVGGKTGVNTVAGKNLVGAFHQPSAVLIDTSTLETLPRRELTAGWCEAVKQGAAGDRDLFDSTVQLLRGAGGPLQAASNNGVDRLIAKQCAFKARIVEGDEREAADRTDSESRRILNFGHTSAHALETVTGYRRFRHGEAVGLGMLVAGEISKGLGLLDPSELELLQEAVRSCGRLPPADDLDRARIIQLISQDKKSVGGKIKWILLSRIGRAAIVDGREIPATLLRASLQTAFQHRL
jgi:3-dehydroquinate synthase